MGLARTFNEFDADGDFQVSFAEADAELRQRFAAQAVQSSSSAQLKSTNPTPGHVYEFAQMKVTVTSLTAGKGYLNKKKVLKVVLGCQFDKEDQAGEWILIQTRVPRLRRFYRVRPEQPYVMSTSGIAFLATADKIEGQTNEQAT